MIDELDLIEAKQDDEYWSEFQANHLAATLLTQRKAQISIYSGKIDGGLSSLQDLVCKLGSDAPVVCEVCGSDIFRSGHWDECKLVENYKAVIPEIAT